LEGVGELKWSEQNRIARWQAKLVASMSQEKVREVLRWQGKRRALRRRLDRLMIDSARKFFLLVRTTGGQTNVETDAAIAALDDIFASHKAAAEHQNLDRDHRERMMFYSGAVVGLKVALRAYAARLREAGREQGLNLKGDAS